MSKRLVSVCVVLALLLVSAPVLASQADEAKGMVEKAAAAFQASGKEKTLKEIGTANGPYVKGELYVFAYDLGGTMVAHPTNPKLVGMNLLNTPDVDGRYFRREIIELAKKSGSGWVDYKYKNPKNGKIEQKTTYLKKAGDVVLCCGAYK